MKYRIKEVTLKNGEKIYTPQWSRLGIFWGGFGYSWGKIRRKSIIEHPVFCVEFSSYYSASDIFGEYEQAIKEEKGLEPVKYTYHKI